jgi:MFS family permease
LFHRFTNFFPGKSGLFYGWYVAAIAWTMIFLTCAVPISLFFKPILDEFGWSRDTLSLVQTVAMLASAAMTPVIGVLIDRLGPRLVLLLTGILQAVSNTITGLAVNLPMIYAGRLFTEIKPIPSTQVLINRWFVKKRGRAQGIIATGMPLASFALIPLSQFLIIAWGWRETLFFWSGLIFCATIILTYFVRNKPEDKGLGPDGVPIERAADVREKVSGAVNKRVEAGNTFAETSRSGAFWLINLTQLICGVGCGFMMTHIVIFATDVGYSEMIGATFVSVQGIFNLFGVLIMGYLSDRMARKKALAVTHFIRSMSFGTVLIAIVFTDASLWILFPAMALFGFGWFTTAPLTAGLSADLFGYRKMGTIVGAVNMSHMIGMAAGVYSGGVVFEATGSYFSFFIIQFGLELLAAVFALSVKRRTQY